MSDIVTPEEIVTRLASVEPMVPSEIDGDLSCFFCGSWERREHKPDCLWLLARARVVTGRLGEK